MQKINFTKILVVTIMVLSLLPFSFAQAIEYGGFGGKPAYPRADNPRTESIFVHTLNLGTIQKEGVLVVNNSKERKTMIVYATDSTPSSGGAFACKQLSEKKTDVGSWINLSKSEVTLDSGTNETIPFAIQVPLNASVGEHNGCIIIQEKKVPVEGQTGAVISVRTGLRVAITIPGDILRKLEIAGFTITKNETGFLLNPLVKNIGNVSIDADAKVTVSYFFGLTHMVFGGQYPILRGDTSEWNFDLKKPFWGGWYRSNFTVSYDENVDATVGVKSGKPLTMLTGPSVWFFSWPTLTALLVEIGILLLFTLIIFFIYRFTKHKKKKRS